MARIYVLNGPNLNLLGQREPEIYGRDTLADVEQRCQAIAAREGVELVFRQSNREDELVDWIQEARKSGGVIINPAGLSYNSVPVLDALKMCECPVVEVHISNIHKRAETEASWRGDSLMSPAATGVIAGLGVHGYELALDFIARRLKAQSPA
ncbi:type II 3-dehydroquinate dehydratase [Phenylobacterium sp. J367]|uniref:type II 3-dehydroquinate dehydratase n=1 Tax=Phenylobacterium sp. J367 TaxID=2898435 RepID=UPI002151A14C|nr:type II 3-dehydroquinate dehydratase [Phenylobacterium sp. J367]MCR5879311.1 3-dehydroquinate dehydratase [Phenylobacterium sp. J367]